MFLDIGVLNPLQFYEKVHILNPNSTPVTPKLPTPMKIMSVPNCQVPELLQITDSKHQQNDTDHQLVPVQNAVIRYNPPAENKIDDTGNFNLMQLLLTDAMDDVSNQDLVLVATQCEQALVPTRDNYEGTTNKNTSVIANTSVMKCNAPISTFTNCKIGLIGTLNIVPLQHWIETWHLQVRPNILA